MGTTGDDFSETIMDQTLQYNVLTAAVHCDQTRGVSITTRHTHINVCVAVRTVRNGAFCKRTPRTINYHQMWGWGVRKYGLHGVVCWGVEVRKCGGEGVLEWWGAGCVGARVRRCSGAEVPE